MSKVNDKLQKVHARSMHAINVFTETVDKLTQANDELAMIRQSENDKIEKS